MLFQGVFERVNDCFSKWETHQNNVFLFSKNHSWHYHIKSKNMKKKLGKHRNAVPNGLSLCWVNFLASWSELQPIVVRGLHTSYIKELGFAELVRVNFIIIYIFLVCLFFMCVGILILVVIRGLPMVKWWWGYNFTSFPS